MKKEDLKRLCERFAEFATWRIRSAGLRSFGQKIERMRFVDRPGESGFENVLEPRRSDGAPFPKSAYDFGYATVAYSRNGNDAARYRYVLKSYARDRGRMLKWLGAEYSGPEELDLKLTAMGF